MEKTREITERISKVEGCRTCGTCSDPHCEENASLALEFTNLWTSEYRWDSYCGRHAGEIARRMTNR